jgi:hypothetical protein
LKTVNLLFYFKKFRDFRALFLLNADEADLLAVAEASRDGRLGGFSQIEQTISTLYLFL